MSVMAGDIVGCRNSNVCPKTERTMTKEAQAKLDELEAELASLGE